MSEPFVSIVVPIYNEAEILEDHLNKIASFFQFHNIPFELIAVNDGSTDSTSAILSELKSALPNLHVHTYEHNRGKGYAVKQGALRARGEWILLTDTDLSTPLEEYHNLFKRVETSSIIIGSRGLENSTLIVAQPFHKQLLGRLGNRVIRATLGFSFRDTQCGFKLFNRAHTQPLFSQLTFDRWGFDFELLYLAAKKGISITEVPVAWKDDPTTAVKPTDYLKTFLEVFKVRLNDWKGKYEDNL